MGEAQYEEYVSKYSDNFIRIVIDDEYAERIKEFANRIVKKKATEDHHLVDNRQELKRFTTGLMGEAALEKLFNMNIIDWTVGDSKDYHHPDVPGYRVGIKSVEKWKFPIIFKHNWYPQIICIISDNIKNLVFVCGMASPDVLNNYQSDNLVIDKKILERGSKTAFWGFPYLTPVKSLDDISRYKRR